MTKTNPFIKAAAIYFRNKLFIGKTFEEIYKNLPEIYYCRSSNYSVYQDHSRGFITSDGKLCSQEMAAEIAFRAGQIKKEVASLEPEDLL